MSLVIRRLGTVFLSCTCKWLPDQGQTISWAILDLQRISTVATVSFKDRRGRPFNRWLRNRLACDAVGQSPHKMNNNISKLEAFHKDSLLQIPKEQNHKIQEKKLIQLLIWLKTYCPWYPPDGSYDLDHWK